MVAVGFDAAAAAVPAGVRPPVLVGAAPAALPRLTQSDAEAWLDGFMPYALDQGAIAGAVVVIVKDGAVLTQRGYGYADVAQRVPVDPYRTLFRLGSVSKLFTWTAVMQLVEQRKINLDADVNTYLDFTLPAPAGRPITMRDLLAHRAGFEDTYRGLISPDAPAAALAEVIRRRIPARVFPAGSTPAYSNYGAALAGYIVQRVSGLAYEAYLQQHVFAAAGMVQASVCQPLPAALAPFLSKGYSVASEPPMPFEYVNLAPAGAATASATDMAKFMLAHLAHGGALLDSTTTHLMHDTRLATVPHLNRMALGFYEQRTPGGRITLSHGGDTRWFHTYLWLFPEEHTGLFVALNSAGRNDAAGWIRTSLFQEFGRRYFSQPQQPLAAARPAAHAQLLAGNYSTSRRNFTSFMGILDLFGQLQIRADHTGALQVESIRDVSGARTQWVETAPFLWRSPDGTNRLAAKVQHGRVVAVALDESAPFEVYLPVPWYRSSVWLSPAFFGSVLLVLYAGLSWPIGALIRRRYALAYAPMGWERLAARLVKAGALASLGVLVGWGAVLYLVADFQAGTGLLALLWTLELVGVGSFVGLVGASLWHLRVSWHRQKGLLSKVYQVLLPLAAGVLVWVAFEFGLLSPGVQF